MTKKKAIPVEVEAATVEVAPPVKNTRVIRVVTPTTEDMSAMLEARLDEFLSDGLAVASCVQYGVDHMVIILQRAAA